VRSYAQPAFENVALWHERDISHSSVERVAVPDACIALDFMLTRFEGVVRNLQVCPERMLENLESTRGTVFSGHLLLALVDKGVSREEAYSLVQKHALAAFDGGATLQERIGSDLSVAKLMSAQEIKAVFDLSRHLKEVDRIVDRALAS
jgi:adenylosuccinate lyase